MTTTRTAILGACAALTLLTACGGEPENTDVGARAGADGVRDVVEVFARAVGEGDGPRACSLLMVPAQRALESRTSSANCLAAVTQQAAALSPEAVQLLSAVDVSSVDDSAESAVATVDLEGTAGDQAAAALGGRELHLVRFEERWSIAEPPA